jgi:biopolymer transport protein ExbB/TolQ
VSLNDWITVCLYRSIESVTSRLVEHVAGPIGEALITTAIGLFVAVPAVIGCNWLLRRNKKLQEKIKHFAAELHMPGRRQAHRPDGPATQAGWSCGSGFGLI